MTTNDHTRNDSRLSGANRSALLGSRADSGDCRGKGDEGMKVYGIEIPPAPRTGDTWAESISIRHLKVYARMRKARLVWDGEKHVWEEDR